MDSASSRLRLSILGVVVLCLFGALFARLWYLQVMAAPAFQVQAQANSARVVAEEAPRGRILDATGKVLVDNRTSLVVTLDPQATPKAQAARDDLVLRLAETLTSFGVPTKVDGIERRLGDIQYSQLQPVPVAVDVPEALEMYLAEQADTLPGVAVERRTIRHYPEGQLAAHVLGYVGRINEAEYKARQTDDPDNPKPYQPSSDIGKGGVEAAYEAELRGKPGLRTIEVDNKQRPVRTVDYQAPVAGNDIQLTIDLDAQRMAETALQQQLEEIRGRRTKDGANIIKSPAGSVVTVDPRNGGVVVMASFPTYDPNDFIGGVSQARYQQLTNDPHHPLLNRAIQGEYAPGSTFKPFTAYSALSAGMIEPNTTVQDDGVYERDGDTQVYRNAGSKGLGSVNLRTSLTASSDWYYYWLGDRFWKEEGRLGAQAQQQGYYQFGFGSRTGTELSGEATGRVPTKEWREQLYDSFSEADKAAGNRDWLPGANMLMAIGQGDMLSTPLQLANAYATLANGGTVYQPSLLKAVLVPGGDPNVPADVIRTREPVVLRQIPLAPELRDPIVQGLRGVTESSAGTASATFGGFDLGAFPIAAKTGTAEVQGKATTSLFASFAPADDPRFATVAVLEESDFGATAAAPVVRRVYEQLFGQQLSNAGDIGGGTE